MRCNTGFGAALNGSALLALFWVSGSLPASAAIFEGSDRSSVCTASRRACETFGFNAKPYVTGAINWQVSTLVGEPVIDTRLAWKPDSIAGHVAPIYREADPMLLLSGGEAAKHLRLYEARARLTVTYGNRTYTIDSDLGVPEPAGDKMSYNVPGSPSWARLFRDADGNYIPPEFAKEIIGSGAMTNATASLLDARVDTSQFETWWLEKNAARYTEPLRAAIDERLAAMGSVLGLPTDDIRAEIAGLGEGMKAGALIAKLEGILRKLGPDNIPVKFLGEGPERLARLKAYADRIGPTEARLRQATKGLPPMPGSSTRYDTWYDQVAVRMNLDAARLAHLQNLKEEADLRAREAAAAIQRERENRARAAAERRRVEEERRQRQWEADSDQAAYDFGGYMADFSSSFASTGWGNPVQVGPTIPGYYYQGVYIGPETASGSDGDGCDGTLRAIKSIQSEFNDEVARGPLSDSEYERLWNEHADATDAHNTCRGHFTVPSTRYGQQ